MPAARLYILLICVLLLTSCEQHSSNNQIPKTLSTKFITDESLGVFYTSLINQENIILDTAWYNNVDSGVRYDDYPNLERARYRDNCCQPIAFPLDDPMVNYCEGGGQDYFKIRGQKISEAEDWDDHAFPLKSIRRFRYRAGNYLVFNGRLRDFNGYGGRINFNYFFDLTHETIVADMYRNFWGNVEILFLYGDLNNDYNLDRLCFEGIFYPSLDKPDTLTITAETYLAKKWQTLMDGPKPYFIKLVQVGRTDSFMFGSCHWMRPVKL